MNGVGYVCAVAGVVLIHLFQHPSFSAQAAWDWTTKTCDAGDSPPAGLTIDGACSAGQQCQVLCDGQAVDGTTAACPAGTDTDSWNTDNGCVDSDSCTLTVVGVDSLSCPEEGPPTTITTTPVPAGTNATTAVVVVASNNTTTPAASTGSGSNATVSTTAAGASGGSGSNATASNVSTTAAGTQTSGNSTTGSASKNEAAEEASGAARTVSAFAGLGFVGIFSCNA